MDKRVLLTVAISMAILFIWGKFFAPEPPKPPTTAPSVAASPTPTTVATAPAASPQPAASAAPLAREKPPAVTATYTEDQRYRMTASSWGAAPTEWKLLHPQYQKEGPDKKLVPIDLVSSMPPNLPLTISFPDSGFNLPYDAAWTQLSQDKNELVYVWDEGTIHVEKRFTFVPGTYQVKIKIVVENRGDQPVAEHLQLNMFGRQDPNVKAGGMFSAQVAQTEGACHINGKLKHGDLQTLVKERIEEMGSVRWVGIDQKYFLAALAIHPGSEMQKCTVYGTTDGLIAASVLLPEKRLAPKEKVEIEAAAFLGPKILAQLDDIKVANADARLGDAMNYGMWGLAEFLARPMLAVLKGVHFVVPNWGIAVILLTVLLKALTWWPTMKSMKSMKEMAKLKPEMDKIKEKYGDDKNRMNQEVMELYKKRGINPLGGCLPMLIQMPIYIALYSMLGNSVELYRSGFVGWIHDLTAPDPYFVLPLLTGVLMFAQQKLSPTPPDPQQKMMMYMMPVMFTAISLFLPAGLTVYILTNTLLTMLQQWWMNRHEPKPTKVTGKPARA
jgi:YidC/Oxa1 family membrane protein insertase